MSARIVVVPPSADVGEIAREMAPAGFELVLARDGSPELEAALGTRRVHGLLPQRDDARCLLSRGAAARAGAAAERRLRRCRPRGGAARQGAGRPTTAAPTPSRSPSTR